MMMCLGTFVFSLAAGAYDQLSRNLTWRHARTERVGARAASQFVGVGEDDFELGGTLVPPLAGRYTSLTTLKEMADTGQPWALVDGNGVVFGAYVIVAMKESHSVFLVDGTPRKIDFQLSLMRVPDEHMAAVQA